MRRDDIERIRSKFKVIINSVSPDYEFGYKFLYSGLNQHFIHLDSICFYTFAKYLSNSGGFDRIATKASTDFARLNKLEKYEYSPRPDELHPFSSVAHEMNRAALFCGLEPPIDAANLDRQLSTVRKKRSFLARRMRTMTTLAGIDRSATLRIKPLMDLDGITAKLATSSELRKVNKFKTIPSAEEIGLAQLEI
jgi:hypothetical protein